MTKKKKKMKYFNNKPWIVFTLYFNICPLFIIIFI